MKLEKFAVPIPTLSDDDIRRCRQIALQRRDVVSEIATAVSAETGIGKALIYGKSRRQSIVHARQLVMYIAHERGISEPLIGLAMNRDPSTVHHGIKAEKARRVGMAKAPE